MTVKNIVLIAGSVGQNALCLADIILGKEYEIAHFAEKYRF